MSARHGENRPPLETGAPLPDAKRGGGPLAAEINPRDLIARAVTMIGDTPNVDVLTRAWNLTWDNTERDVAVIDVEGVPIPTVSLAHLIESKRTWRTQDTADIELLETPRGLREK